MPCGDLAFGQQTVVMQELLSLLPPSGCQVPFGDSRRHVLGRGGQGTQHLHGIGWKGLLIELIQPKRGKLLEGLAGNPPQDVPCCYGLHNGYKLFKPQLGHLEKTPPWQPWHRFSRVAGLANHDP